MFYERLNFQEVKEQLSYKVTVVFSFLNCILRTKTVIKLKSEVISSERVIGGRGEMPPIKMFCFNSNMELGFTLRNKNKQKPSERTCG